jgi:hypothetical protein
VAVCVATDATMEKAMNVLNMFPSRWNHRSQQTRAYADTSAHARHSRSTEAAKESDAKG